MRAMALGLAVLLAACATPAPPPLPEAREPGSAIAARPGPKLALVLSSGGARAFAHVGVISELERLGLRPDLIVGSSGGALVGALYAKTGSAARLEALTHEIDWSALFPGPLTTRLGAGARGNTLERLLREQLGPTRFESLPIEFAAVATDLADGRPEVFSAGDVARAVRASASAPGRFLAVSIRGRRYMDGALASPVPVRAARALGADYVIAVDVTYPPRDAAPVEDLSSLVYQAFFIQEARITEWELEQADLVLRPQIPPTTETYTDHDRDMLIAAGRAAVRAQAGRLAGVAGAWRARRAALGAPQALVQLHHHQDRERHAEHPRP